MLKVKGHQDEEKEHEDLDWWGRTNVCCDNPAKAHLARITDVSITAKPAKFMRQVIDQ